MAEEAIGGPLTAAQAACLMAYLGFVGLWLYAEYTAFRSRGDSGAHSEGKDAEEIVPLVIMDAAGGVTAAPPPGAGTNGAPPAPPSSKASATAVEAYASPETGLFSSTFVKLLVLDPAALAASRGTLCAAVEMGTIVLWFYLADRTTAIGAGAKEYIRDVFLFIFLVLTLVASFYTTKKGRASVLINRQQTEEWKGWMQVLFLLYHYYEAREFYNAIRVFIACYVWMTGFGNFAYYYKTRDFSLGRFAQMMWRLNLLAVLCCAALGNQYMLYYICPMHTLFTVMVYGSLGLWRGGLDSQVGVWVKIAACVAVVAVVWEIKPVFYALWSPLRPLLAYTDPRRPHPDSMHEWFFRSGLDRYIWIHGMVCAYLHPRFEAWLKALDEGEPRRRRAVRGVLTAAALAAGYAWYLNVYRLPKLEYNRLHPFTSWIPITAFLVLRNMTPDLRLYSIGLYGWLGCITLETYVAQYHTWLLSKVPNSQPIYLLTLLPGYPLLNFAAVTAVYVFLSHRLFLLTATLRDAVVPHDDDTRLRRNIVTAGAAAAALLAAGFALTGALALVA